MLEGEADGVAVLEPEPGPDRGLLHLHLHGPREPEDAGAAPAQAAVVQGPEQGMDQAVLGPGRELGHHLHRAVGALDAPEQGVGRVGAQVVAPLVGPHRQRVGHRHGAGRRPERGLEHQRAVQVSALGPVVVVGGADGPVAGVVVEQAGEDGRRVEARDRASPPSRPG